MCSSCWQLKVIERNDVCTFSSCMSDSYRAVRGFYLKPVQQAKRVFCNCFLAFKLFFLDNARHKYVRNYDLKLSLFVQIWADILAACGFQQLKWEETWDQTVLCRSLRSSWACCFLQVLMTIQFNFSVSLLRYWNRKFTDNNRIVGQLETLSFNNQHGP